MGYQTDFELSFDHAAEELTPEILSFLRKVTGYQWEDCYLFAATWYDHDDDMLALSLAYPDILFTLEGNGEDNGDLWITYYKNGKMQECAAEVVYPPYDETKMM